MNRTIGLPAVLATLLGLAPAAVAQKHSIDELSAQDTRNARIAGRVNLPSGMSAEKTFRVTLSNSTNPLVTIFSNSHGEFRFEGLPAGQYTIDVVDESGRFASGRESLYLGPEAQA